MINGKKLVVVLPAYNAGRTLEKTYREIPLDIVDEVILVDDDSTDDTVELARSLGIAHVIRHDRNRGYGGNQKTCYDKDLERGAEIVVMLHPDYQYPPPLIASMASLIALGIYPVVPGSRILGKGGRAGVKPLYKYVANRVLTLVQNLVIGQKLSEYHTGYRTVSAEVLRNIDYHANSDSLIFDNETLPQVFTAGYHIGEVSCPTRYFDAASSIGPAHSVRYGLGVLRVSLQHVLHRAGLVKCARYGGGSRHP